MLLVVGAATLFGIATLGIYRGINTHQEILIESEVLPRAILHAERFIEEARTRAFDEASLSKEISSPNELTSPDSLGPNKNENYPSFDDVDDFHGLVQTWDEEGIRFQVQINVCYANGTLPGSIEMVTYRTYMKKFTATITSSYLNYSVTLDHIFAYY